MVECRFLSQVSARGGLEPLFDAMLEGMVVRDGNGRIVASNPASCRILGLTAEEMHGCALESLPLRYLREDGSPFAPGLLPAIAARQAGQPQRNVVVGIVREGGEPVWIQLNSQPLADSSGGVVADVTTFADITATKRAEAALRATEARNRTLAEAIAQSGSAVIITDGHGTIEYVNPACCAAYGYSVDELLGASPRIFKSGETPPEVYAALWRTILAGETWRGELSNRSRDGRLIREAVTISPVRDECGAVRHFVAVKEDLTQLREDERRRHELFERIARLERMEVVGTLASGIAHDFNNVLVAILGYSELAKSQLPGDAQLQRVAGYIDEIRSAGARARDLIQQLLGLSRSGTARGRHAHLDAVVGEAVGLLRATLPDTVALIGATDPRLAPLAVDPGHVHQMLMNLLVNARDAIAGKGTIRLSTRRVAVAAGTRCDSCRCEVSGDYVAIGVSDDGPGISAEARSRLFEPFFTTKEPGRGTGMGLAVVHGMAHLYDGHVRVSSTPHEGCEFEVLLPARLLADAPAVA